MMRDCIHLLIYIPAAALREMFLVTARTNSVSYFDSTTSSSAVLLPQILTEAPNIDKSDAKNN